MYNDISVLKMSEISGVTNRSTIKRYLTFKPNRDTSNIVKNQIKFLLSNINDIEPTRLEYNGKKRIVGFKHIEPVNEQAFLYDHRSSWSDSFGTLSSTGKKKSAEVLIRYSIMKLKKELLPNDVKEQELQYLNLLYNNQLERKKAKTTPYIAYSYVMESEALLKKQVADIKRNVTDEAEVKRLIAFAESYHKKRIEVKELPTIFNEIVTINDDYDEVVNF